MTRQTAAINAGPGHDRPERARACLLTGEVVAATAAEYASYRPRLGETSRRAIESADRPDAPSAVAGLPVRRTLRTRGKQLARRYGSRSARPPMMGRTSPT